MNSSPQISPALNTPLILLLIFACAGCDPIVTIAGASFPGWLLCMLLGAALTAVTRPLLIVTRLESYLGPLTIFYPALIAMFAMLAWILLFNRI